MPDIDSVLNMLIIVTVIIIAVLVIVGTTIHNNGPSKITVKKIGEVIPMDGNGQDDVLQNDVTPEQSYEMDTTYAVDGDDNLFTTIIYCILDPPSKDAAAALRQVTFDYVIINDPIATRPPIAIQGVRIRLRGEDRMLSGARILRRIAKQYMGKTVALFLNQEGLSSICGKAVTDYVVVGVCNARHADKREKKILYVR